MGTVSKALLLVNILAGTHSPKGLTGIAAAAGFDKATTRRLLLELCENGYVVQDAESRDYELGPALQVLGNIRQERFSLYRTTLPFVRAISDLTQETVHASEYNAGKLLTICVQHSSKPIRVNMDADQKLPLHATASGIAFLAAASDSFVEGILAKPLPSFTRSTLTNRKAINSVITEAKRRGYSSSNQSLQEGVSSVAAAIHNQLGKPIGAIAIAVPSQRMSPKLTAELGLLVQQTAADISQQLSGRKLKLRETSAAEATV